MRYGTNYKRSLTALLSLALLLVVGFGPYLPNRRQAFRKPAAAGGGGECSTPGSPVLHETLEGTGYSAGGWSELGSGGTIDEDYTTSPAPLVGSQSLYIAPATDSQRFASHTFTSGATRYVRFKLRVVALPSGSYSIVQILGSFSTQSYLYIRSDGKLAVQHGSATSSDTTDAISAGTTYTIWMRHTKGTGSDGIAEVGFATDCTRPTGGNKFTSVTTGTSTVDVDEIYWGLMGFAGSPQMIFDELVVDDAVID
jgi:hypothetical protein